MTQDPSGRASTRSRSTQNPPADLASLKGQAKRLRQALAGDGRTISHSQALEMLAHQHGFRDWNGLHAAVGNRPPITRVQPGDRVSGTYLGQAFEGEILGLTKLADGGAYRIVLHFDQPVDVVRFDSFSAFRQRVSSVVSLDGISPARTSDGNPHLRLDFS